VKYDTSAGKRKKKRARQQANPCLREYRKKLTSGDSCLGQAHYKG